MLFKKAWQRLAACLRMRDKDWLMMFMLRCAMQKVIIRKLNPKDQEHGDFLNFLDMGY